VILPLLVAPFRPQHVFAGEAAALGEGSKVGVLLCGQKDMATSVTELCKAQGVEQILSNF
jgi:hypothetical protein